MRIELLPTLLTDGSEVVDVRIGDAYGAVVFHAINEAFACILRDRIELAMAECTVDVVTPTTEVHHVA
jgi:hypothetical protein